MKELPETDSRQSKGGWQTSIEVGGKVMEHGETKVERSVHVTRLGKFGLRQEISVLGP